MPDEAGVVSKIKASKDVLAAALLVLTVLSGVVKFAFDEAMESRDKANADMAREIGDLSGRHAKAIEDSIGSIQKIESAQAETLDALRIRFQRTEVIDTEIQGAVNALRTEIRVRHREDPGSYGVSRGTRHLKHLSRETDRMLIRSQNAIPQDDPFTGL